MENVLLVFGGMSYEHDISIVTASQMFNKTRLKNQVLVPLYISKTNRFYVYKSEIFDISDFANFDEKRLKKCFKEVMFVSGEKGVLFSKSLLGLKEYLRSDLAINACHGGDGENGKLIVFLEKFGIFTASGSVEGLGISMNKMLFKTFMRGAKIPVVSGFVISSKIYYENKEFYDSRLKFARFPLVLKPVSGGSSIGLFIAKTKDEFEKMLFSAFEFDDNVLVEKFISNAREFNVAVVGDENEIIVSEVDEPLKISEVLSFEDKYLSGTKQTKGGVKAEGSMLAQKRNFPAKISEDIRETLRNYSLKVFKTMELSGVVRIDFLFDESANKIYVCEVNAVPGSLSYYFFEQGEVLINKFVSRLITIAAAKKEKGSQIKIDYITNVLN